MKTHIATLIATLLVAACAGPVLGTPEQAQTAAGHIVIGTVGTPTQTTEAGQTLWDVPVTMPNGAVVTVLLVVDSGELFEVEDLVGPFDYQISPLPTRTYLDYGEARTAALARISGTVVAWKLELEDTKYLYEVYVRDDAAPSQLWEIKLWADTAMIFSVLPKDMID